MENKTRINWIALSIGFALALSLAVPILPSTKWIALTSYRQLNGDKDIWHLSPDRVKGDSQDEQLARILLTQGKDRISTLEQFINDNPDRLDARAHYLRYQYQEHHSPNDVLAISKARELAIIARDGQVRDSDNLYWSFIEGAFWLEAEEPDRMREAILSQPYASGFDDYGLDEAEVAISALRHDDPSFTRAEEVVLIATVSFPHMAGFKSVANTLTDEDIDERVAVARLSTAMSANVDTLIGFLVAKSISKTALLPGLSSTRTKATQSDYEAAYNELLALRLQDKETLSNALALASAPNIRLASPEEEFDWFTAMEAQHSKWYLATVAWILGSTLTILLGKYLPKLANNAWILRFAPFVGFLLLGWVALAVQTSAHAAVSLWDWHVPEIAVGGFLIGFLALSEKFAIATRVAAVILSLLVIPAVSAYPYIAVPIVAIWISLYLTSKHGQKKQTYILRALLPCLLTLPLALLLGTAPAVSVGLLLLIVTVLALPMGSSMNIPDNKRQMFALSIFIPCLALAWIVQLNIATDASLSRGLEIEREHLTEHRDTVQT